MKHFRVIPNEKILYKELETKMLMSAVFSYILHFTLSGCLYVH